MNIRFYGISVCVFCGSACGKDSAYAREMYKLGKHISNNNWNLIYGGGNLGLMGEIARGFDKSKSKLVSIVPRSLDKKNILVGTKVLDITDEILSLLNNETKNKELLNEE